MALSERMARVNNRRPSQINFDTRVPPYHYKCRNFQNFGKSQTLYAISNQNWMNPFNSPLGRTIAQVGY